MSHEEKDEKPTVKKVIDEHEKKEIENKQKEQENRLKYQASREAEAEKRDLVKQLAEAMGYKQQQEDIDMLKQGYVQLSNDMQNVSVSLSKMVEQIDKQSQAINQLSGVTQGAPQNPGQAPSMGNVDQLAGLAEVVEKLGQVWNTVKGNNAPAPVPLIDQQTINEKMTRAFMDDLETGESIRKFISDSLKKKATRQIVNQSLGDLHGPE